MTPDPEFQQLVAQYLEHHTTRELASEMECAPSTVRRWAEGFATPLPGMRELIKRYIRKLMEEEKWDQNDNSTVE